MNHRRTLTISNESKNLSLVRQAVTEVLELTPFDPKTRTKIILAVDEALANVVEHAYQGGRGDIFLAFEIEDGQLQVAIRDNGVRFEPSEARLNKQIDIHEHIRLGLKGGLGLFLMKQIMDEVRYAHETPYVNELVMVKRFPPPPEGAAPPG